MAGDASDFYALAVRLESAVGRVGGPVAAVVKKTATNVQRDARALAPVGHDGFEDGHLRDSIVTTFEGDGRFASMTAQIEATATYAGYVEDGTSDTPPQPFMRPAFERNTENFERDVAAASGGLL